jgi:hypothetical protein
VEIEVGTKVSQDEVISAMRQTMGNISLAARRLGVSRVTIYNYIKRYKKVKEAHEEFREQAIDNAESALQRAVLNGEGWAVCFTLKTLGKSRGYIERQEIEHSGGIEVTIIDDIKAENE